MANVEASTETYPPFSGDNPQCVKCANKGARTTYLAHGHCSHGPESTNNVMGWEPNERLHRECRRCDYQWDEAVVPA